jgi:hypothetical protein
MAWGTLPLNNLWQHQSKVLMRLRKPSPNKVVSKRLRQEEEVTPVAAKKPKTNSNVSRQMRQEEDVTPVTKKPKIIIPNVSRQIQRVQTMLLHRDNHQRDLERQENYLYRRMEHAWHQYVNHYERNRERLHRKDEEVNDRRAVY